VQAYLNQKKVPQLFVATGASKWGLDYKNNPWTIGWQPNYISESITYAKHLLANNTDPKIAVLYQNDDYGEDYLNGLTKGLGSKASAIIAKKSYESTAADVKSEVAALKASNANTFFIFATPKYSIQALATAAQLGWKPTIYLNNVSAPQSFMKTATTAGGGPASTNGVISTAYLKDPADSKWADDTGMKLYKKIMSQYYSSGDPTDGFNFYGIGAASTMVDALKKAGKNLSRASLMEAVKNLNQTDNPFVLPGVVIKTTPTDRFPITQETLERFDGSKWVPFGNLIDTRGQLT
jgi:branched-chain amino acid transport system substrate-binding protein